MWLMLQQDTPEDYVISTGMQHSVQNFIDLVANEMKIKIKWEGEGIDKIGIDVSNDKTVIKVSDQYFRPTEVEELIGNSEKAIKNLGWKPKKDIKDLVKEMAKNDLDKAKIELEISRC